MCETLHNNTAETTNPSTYENYIGYWIQIETMPFDLKFA